MTEVDSPARTTVCSAGGTTVGFAGTATRVRMKAETVCSCGGRHPVPPAPPGAPGSVAAVGLFASAGRLAQTWVDPAAGILGRGALSQTRLYYAVTRGAGSADRVIRFSTDLDDLAGAESGAGPPVWSAVVAATLAGQPLPMPLTPYEGVFQLACGTTLAVTGGRERLSLHELDPAELVDHASRLIGRPADPREAVRRALRHAIVDVLDTARTDGMIGDGGGLGAAALASVGSARLRRLHVHLEVPVLDRRRGRLAADAIVVDGTAHWRRVVDGPQYGFPHDTDPWPPAPDLLAHAGLAAVPLLSGAGLVRMLAGGQSKTGRLRTGWLQLTTASPFPALFGEPGWRAWHPPRDDGMSAPQPSRPHVKGHDHEGDHDHGHGHGHDSGPGGWISPLVAHAGVAVTSGRTPSHLIPAGDDPREQAEPVPGAGAVQAVIEGLERVPPPAPGDPRLTPVLICAHPVVLGAAVLLAWQGRSRVRRRDGYLRTTPLLRALIPDGWLPADVTPDERDRLLAAAFVTRRLATQEQRARLLAQVEGSPWIDAGRLRAVLADGSRVLADAQALHRLCVTAAHHPQVMNAGAR
ncbi:MAG TPA: hypothetical protein VF069_28845 [Streptosporangiaceae bacterium]